MTAETERACRTCGGAFPLERFEPTPHGWRHVCRACTSRQRHPTWRTDGYATRDPHNRGGGVDFSAWLAPLRLQGTADPRRSLTGLARTLGLHPSVVQLWANGRRTVPQARVEALRAALADLGITGAAAAATAEPAQPLKPATLARLRGRARPRGRPERCSERRAERLGDCIDDLCVDPLCARRTCRDCGALWLGRSGDHAELVRSARSVAA